eukprot:gene8521-345_t
MNDDCFKLAENLISTNYVKQSQQAVQKTQKKIQTLLSQRKLPLEGWSDSLIELFISQLSQMDSNNYPTNVGVGEREGRVYSSLVQKRNYFLTHGIGRSGDIAANQPKAAGSSLILSLTNLMVLHSIKLAGGQSTKKCIVVPMCTGMSLSLVFTTLASKNKKGKYVLWSRIDQKSCFKSIFTASLTPEVVELNFQKDKKSDNKKIQKLIDENEDGLITDLDKMEKKMIEMKDEILCVMSTTSCFAPRLPDRVIDIAKLCKKYNIPHVVNNAYGIQSRKIMNQLSTASVQGRVDAFVQSTDKNYMVPVGGAIIASSDDKFIDSVAQVYSGRGSISSVLDIFITLLSLGENGWIDLLKERESMLNEFVNEAEKVAKKFNEKILKTKSNEISFVMTLDNFKDPSPRVVVPGTKKEICGIKFDGYGSHTNKYPHAYLTIACAIGIRKEEIKLFFQRLEKVLDDCFGKNKSNEIELIGKNNK